MPVEVQIRTHKMHYIAEYGFAAHWKYKEKLSDEDEWLDKEVQYKKWLTNYKLGVHDKKIRPSGSPPTDSSLKSLGVHLLDATHPDHRTKVDPFLQHDRFKLQFPSKQSVSIVVATNDTVETRELPYDYTVAQLSHDLGVDALPGYALTINQRLPDADAAFRNGDLVQIVPVQEVLSRSPPNQLNVYLPGHALPLTLAWDKVAGCPPTVSYPSFS